MNPYTAYFESLGKAARSASMAGQVLSTEDKNHILEQIACDLETAIPTILEANSIDCSQAKENGVPSVMMDRLRLTKERIEGICEGVRQVANLRDPIGTVLETRTLENGLRIEKRQIPIGVIGMIYEARPNVTVDAAALAIKTGNAIILRGGKEAYHTSEAMVQVMQSSLERCGAPKELVQLVSILEREAVGELLAQRKWIDVMIPRGGAGLIQFVVNNSKIPVIETGSGVVHGYVDASADEAMALQVLENAKLSRPSVCNAMETILLHEARLHDLGPKIVAMLKEKGVTIYGDDKVQSLSSQVKPATEDNWATEYNDYIVNFKVVASIDDAIDHINTFGTKHSEMILTEDPTQAERFMNLVDASTVYVNASTRFTDGFEFGLGAEIGISTQKLHARGPMGLDALTSYKYFVFGHGQVR
ncbi:glutamate-5-semialdehyde dehydrogenase [Veillonella sp. 3310]|uniref:glutamate-5-semialdehyde dehydrogenase n=1 Tax=Veillonella sp. 3310 TaxID=2490956 RepID=UPI000FD6457F|nr:glutamate-5-semialdehyde dehydrogenase [Veillonella sp. 3310]